MKISCEKSIDSLQVVVCVIKLSAVEEVGVVCRNSSLVNNNLSSASKKMLTRREECFNLIKTERRHSDRLAHTA